MGNHTQQKKPVGTVEAERPRFRPRVVVRFVPGVLVKGGDPESPQFTEEHAASWDKLSLACGRLTLHPLFRAVGKERLAELGKQADPRYFPDPEVFDSFYQAEYGPGVDPEDVVKLLRRARDLVMTAYLQGRPGAPPARRVGVATLEADQHYLDPAPDGIGARLLMSEEVPGSDGEGVGFVDIEQGWVLDHVDLPASPMIPEPDDPDPGRKTFGLNLHYRGHGTSVLGIVLAQKNERMCIGIAPRATAHVVSQWRTEEDDALHDALAVAVNLLGPGDVLLIEGQYNDPGSSQPGVQGPVEIQDDVFYLIRLATARGITVIEPAGNGSFDLDLYADSRGKPLFAPEGPSYWRDYRDSGAVVVGAGSSGTVQGRRPDPDTPLSHQRGEGSNYGDRVDCYAWGDGVTTLGDGGSGLGREDVTNDFNGTSSASAIVAGIAIAIQGMALEKIGKPYTPRQIREILRDPFNGTASADPAKDRIGVMPDLRLIASSVVGVIPDVYARDFLGDDGMFHYGPLGASPDLFVRREAGGDPDRAFGEGSGRENDDALHEGIQGEGTHFVFLRTRNRGGGSGVDVNATLYCAPVATVLREDLWEPIGQVRVERVPAGNVLRVSAPRNFDPKEHPESVGPQGDLSLIALVGAKGDPGPERKSMRHWRTFVRWVREENNLAIRNLHDRRVRDDDLAAGSEGHLLDLPFLVTGAPDVERAMWFELASSLPEKSELCLTLTPALSDLVETVVDQQAAVAAKASVSPWLIPNGRSRLAPVRMAPGLKEPCTLRITLPKTERARVSQIFVRQMLGDLEVGRITWRIFQQPRNPREPKK